MNKFQKIIKYVAIAFALYLAVAIIGAIVTGVLAISTGIFGISIIKDSVQDQPIEGVQYLEGFSKVDLEIVASNLQIKAEGDSYRVEYAQVSNSTKISNKDGELKVTDNRKIITPTNGGVITIYVPEGSELEEVELEMGAGNVEIENINSKKIDFSFGAGSVAVKNLVAANSKIECGAGQVIIEESDLTNTDLDTGVGKLVYSGYMKGKSNINCGIGEVDLNLAGGPDLYSIDADKGIGDIKINGNKVDDESVTGNGENKISIDGGIGSIEVNM